MDDEVFYKILTVKTNKIYVFRHFLGEDLGTLGVKELQKLEKQLEKTLALSRQRKVHMCMNINFPTAHAHMALYVWFYGIRL